MTPQFTPGSYVRAVQITGLWGRWHEGHIMKVGRLVAIHDTESYWGSYEVAFGNGMKYMVLEIEPATKADYDADWPDDDAAQPLPPINSYVRAVQITPSDEWNAYIGQVCRVVDHNEGDDCGDITCVFRDSRILFVLEWEPANEADFGSEEPAPFKTAAAVLTAGNDPGLQFLRTQLKQAEQNLEFYERRVADEKQLENTILDLIAARMDQLKGDSNA